MLDEKIKTWGNMDILLIKKAYDNIAPLIESDFPDKKTRKMIKKLMKQYLPDYKIKCDEENNPPNVMDSGHIFVQVRTETKPDGSFNFIDVIF